MKLSILMKVIGILRNYYFNRITEISKLNIIFFDYITDENAACHLAIIVLQFMQYYLPQDRVIKKKEFERVGHVIILIIAGCNVRDPRITITAISNNNEVTP